MEHLGVLFHCDCVMHYRVEFYLFLFIELVLRVPKL